MGNPNELPTFAIPPVLVPPTTVCVSFQWPDDPDHLAILVALVQSLARWNFWDQDAAHSGKTLADLYKKVASSMQIGCDLFEVRQDPADPCLLDYSTDGGVTWIQFADISLCVNKLIPPGTPGYGNPGQQPGGGVIPHGQCKIFNMTVEGGHGSILPIPLAAGYTVQIDNPQGLFSDFSTVPIVGAWYCYDGSEFLVNVCSGFVITSGLDPSPSDNHMRILLKLPDGTYHPLTAGTPFTVPSPMTSGSYYLISNNPGGGNFGGSVTLAVKICNEAATGALTITPQSDPFACVTQGTVDNANPNIGDVVSFASTLSPDGFYAICQVFDHASTWQITAISIPAGTGDCSASALLIWHGSHPTDNGVAVGQILSGSNQIGYNDSAWSFSARLISIP